MDTPRVNIDFRSLHPIRKNVTFRRQGERNLPNSLGGTEFNLSDYNWHSSQFDIHSEINEIEQDRDSTLLRNIKKNGFINIPKLVLTEFQPRFQFNWSDIAILLLGELLEGQILRRPENQRSREEAIERIPENQRNTFQLSIDTLRETLSAGTRDFGDTFRNNLITEIARNPIAAQNNLIDIPIGLVRNMFSGVYIAKFEIPYFGDTYLHAKGDEGWSKGGESSLIGQVQNFINKALPVDIPVTPEWNNNEGGSAPPEIEEEIILNNDNFEHLVKNFQFLHALISGAFWAQIGFFQKSPNLYDVHCPGRFHYYFCTMNMKVDYSGKVRALSKDRLDNFRGRLGKNLSTVTTKNDQIKDDDIRKTVKFLDKGVNPMFPDAYKLTVNLSSLMPNSFNTYLDYLINSVDRNIVEVGVEALDAGERIRRDVQKFFNSATNPPED